MIETPYRPSVEYASRIINAIVTGVPYAFDGNPRVIVGTGDQVGRETPEENLYAMIDEATRYS